MNTILLMENQVVTFEQFENSLFSGNFFKLEHGPPSEVGTEQESQLVLAFYDVIYGVNPILSYERLKSVVINGILANPDIDECLRVKANILYTFTYGYIFQENGVSEDLELLFISIDDYFMTQAHREQMRDWYTLYLGQKFWLEKFNTTHVQTLDGFHLALDTSDNQFLTIYLHLSISFASVLKRDMISLKLYLKQARMMIDSFPNPWLEYFYHLIESQYLNNLGKYEDCITAIKTGIGIAERYRYSGFDMIVKLLVIASGTTRQRVIEHVKYLQDKVEQYKHMQFPFGEAVMLSNIAHMYYNIKFYSNYQNHVDQELAIINQWSFTERAIIRYQQLGLYNLGIRTDPRKAFEYFALSKRLTQSVTDDQSFLNSYHTTGFAQYYQFKGELQLAIQQYMQSVLSPESSAHFKILARSHSGIAVNLTNQGNFDKAHERLRKATDYFYPIRHANYDSWVGSLLQLAILQTKTHRSEEAKETLESVIRFSSDSSQSVDRMIPIRARLELFKLNCIDPLIGEYDKEEGYRHLEDYYLSNTDLSPVKHYLKLIKAIKSKNMPRLENKIEGLRLYRELALDAELAHDLRVEIYLALIEILGMEYKISNEDEVRQEIIKRLDQLYGMGVGVNFYIMVHYFVLNAKIEQADRNFKGADGLLQSAQDMCEKYNLSHLLEIVKEERVELNELLALWDDSLHSNQTLLAKIKQNNLDEYIKKMLSLT